MPSHGAILLHKVTCNEAIIVNIVSRDYNLLAEFISITLQNIKDLQTIYLSYGWMIGSLLFD